jgi:hypothetical protein
MSASREFITDELYQYDDVPVITNGQIKINAGTIDFASATPTSDLFPVEDFKIVLNEVRRELYIKDAGTNEIIEIATFEQSNL